MTINPAPLHSPQMQNSPSAEAVNNQPNPELVDNATAADNCMDLLLGLFEENSSMTAQLEGHAVELASAVKTEEQGTQIQEQGTQIQEQGNQTQEQGKVKEAASAQVENEGRAVRAAAIKEGMNAEGVSSKAFEVSVNDQGQLQLKSASSMSQTELEQSHADKKVAFKHGNIIGLSPEFCALHAHHGFLDGQKISYIDENGVKHELTVHHLDATESKQLSNIVRLCIAQMPENRREKDTEDNSHNSKTHNKVRLTDTHNFAVLHSSKRHVNKESPKADKSEDAAVARTHKEIKAIEEGITENSRARLRSAQVLNRYIEKMIGIIASDSEKFDNKNQSLMLDNFKSDHSFVRIPREILVK
ncbi:MAG: hypothetical protein JSS12_09220 [Verrucomicrobia bacterium]|nr:hypothetical protein [Verrucomicrobiota bacterium]